MRETSPDPFPFLNALGDLGYEFGISCELDGKDYIDLVAGSWVEPVEINGAWECADCIETGDSSAEEGYVKTSFATREALLLDHMEPTLKGIAYLCSASRVGVYLNHPDDPANRSSWVMLREDMIKPLKMGKSFQIPIGQVTLDPYADKADETALWIHNRLAAQLARFQSE